MNRTWAVFAALALFASGLAVGALGAHLLYSQKIVETGPAPMPMGPMFGRWLTHRLDLAPEQRREVEEILRRSRAEGEELRREMGPKLLQLNRETIEAISEVLTPEQREQLSNFLERHERRGRRFGPEGGRRRRAGPPPP